MKAVRRLVEARIERDLAFLDLIDGDSDIEPSFTSLGDVAHFLPYGTTDEMEDGGDDELSLGWPANVGQLRLQPNTAEGEDTAVERHGLGFVRSGPDDAEDDGTAEAEPDGEPTLGWPESFGRRRQISDAGMYAQASDGEAEDGGDSEPWLGALERHPSALPAFGQRDGHQLHWGQSDTSDREIDGGDEGEPEDHV